jgi:2-methylcitrate dehydratase PrpD
MDISHQFAANVVKTGFSSFDELTISRARWRVLDAIGCLIAGADTAGCKAMLTLVKQWGGAPESTVLVLGVKAPAHHAAMMNSLMTRSFDFEPVDAEGENTSSPGHISGTTVPTALAMAEYQGAGGKALITALVLGDDIACRLGVASGFDFELGWDNTGTINGFGATAVAGKLLGLDEKQLHNAFGIVLNQLAGSMDGVYDKSMSFKLPIALSARNGIFAAEMAKEGFAGVKDPFTGAHGFFKLYCRNANTANLAKDLGKRFYGDTIHKPYSACRMTHSSIDSALKIAGSKDFNVADIKEIEILLTPGTFKGFCSKPLLHGETPQVEAAFSIPYTVACALLRRDVKPEYFTDAAINDSRIVELIAKIKLVSGIPADKGQKTEMNVKMKGGQTLTASTDFPRGHYVKTPLTAEEVKAKYRNNMAYSKTVSAKKAEKALALIEKLQDLKDVRELTELLVK